MTLLEALDNAWPHIDALLAEHYRACDSLGRCLIAESIIVLGEARIVAHAGSGEPSISQEGTTAVLAWIANGEVGLSSKTMAFCALGIAQADNYHPLDPDDFVRCLKLVRAAPIVRERFGEIALLSPTWSRLIAAWDDLELLLLSEVGSIDACGGKLAPKTYARMQELRA